MSERPKVFNVIVQIRAPRGDDPGQVAEGRYILVDGTVTLTDHTGRPVRDHDGKTYSRKVNEGDDPRVIAGRLTKEFRRVIRGENKIISGFRRPIVYPKIGIV